MNWYEFKLTSSYPGGTFLVTRESDGTISPRLDNLTIPASAAVDFVNWLKADRPLEAGDLVSFKTGRYSNDAAEVIAVSGDLVWIHAIWATSSEHEIVPITYIKSRISLDEALVLGFRPKNARAFKTDNTGD